MSDERDAILNAFRQHDPTGDGRLKVPHLRAILTMLGMPGKDIQRVMRVVHDRWPNGDLFYEDFLNWIHDDKEGFSSSGYRVSDGAFLAKALAKFPTVDCPAVIGLSAPKRDSGFAELVAQAPSLEYQTVNRIKKCPKCGKPCAVSMQQCNACFQDLTSVAESTTSNLFVGMIFGVGKAPFPLRISMRRETNDMLVFDDPLAITLAHVLAVPTDVYVPDIRSLFTAPAAGLALVQKMDQAAWECIESGHLADAAWRKKVLSVKGNEESMETLRSMVMGAFNLPPSQYQLHLQYMLPPLMPHHFNLWKKGAHYVKLRHFPYAFIVQALQALIAAGKALPDAPQMSAEDLVQTLADYGVDYDAAYQENMADLEKSNALLANFKSEDFGLAIASDKVYESKMTEVVSNPPSIKDLENADKMALQNYGRPYGADGKPGGTYYSYARDPIPLPELGR